MGALFSAVAGWLVRTVLIKFVLFTVMYLVVTAVVGYLLSKLPGPGDLNAGLAAWTPGMWFFADLTLWTQFFPGLLSAYITRFAIRRIPLFG